MYGAWGRGALFAGTCALCACAMAIVALDLKGLAFAGVMLRRALQVSALPLLYCELGP